MVPDDPDPVQHVCLHDHPDQRHLGRILCGQLQLQHHDRVDPMVGTADDVSSPGTQPIMVSDVSVAFAGRVAPTVADFRR